MLEIKRHKPESEISGSEIQSEEKESCFVLQNIHGLITFKIDENFKLLFIEGAIEEITGYTKEEFSSNKLKLEEIIEPKDYPLILKT